MSDKVLPDGPFEVELKIHFTNDEDGTDAAVAYTLRKGKYPDREAVILAIKEATKAVPDGFHLLNRREYFKSIVGPGFASPGPDAFPDAEEFKP